MDDSNLQAKLDVKQMYKEMPPGTEKTIEYLMKEYMKELDNKYPMVVCMQFGGHKFDYVRTDEFDKGLQKEIQQFLVERRPYTRSSVDSRSGVTYIETVKETEKLLTPRIVNRTKKKSGITVDM
jgi:hypothetical protein